MSSSSDADASRLDRELATSNVNRAATLVGSSMAVFTFLLFFLYPRFSSGQIDPILFQITLALIVFTIFSFGFSGLYYYGLVGISKLCTAKKQSYFGRANLFFVLGLLFAVAEPALILFTVGLTVLGLAALFLWLLYTYFIVRQATELSNRERGTPVPL
jgi:O-antigen/teichoic acid export membrane protein